MGPREHPLAAQRNTCAYNEPYTPPPSDHEAFPSWVDAKVHPDHHIQVARAAPTRYLHASVRVRADSTMVKIHLGIELIRRAASGSSFAQPSVKKSPRR